jgi:hypothetical protein
MLCTKVADLTIKLNIQKIIKKQIKKQHVSLMITTITTIKLPTILMKTVIVMLSLKFFWKRRRII